MRAKRYKPTCLQCHRPALDKYSGYYCSLRCAANRALESAMDVEWCGKRHEDNPHGDYCGPHGWWNSREESECPECADEREMAKEAEAEEPNAGCVR